MAVRTGRARKVGLLALGFGGLVIATEAACSLTIDTDGLAGGDDDGRVEVEQRDDGGDALDSGLEVDASPGEDAADAAEACPGDAGPASVRVDGFCIDSTEVTNADYARFLEASVGVAGQPAVCAWNLDYVPTGSWPPSGGALDRPVVNVDWCDARAYCAWAGKRLCGAVSGGATPPGALADSARDQWYRACSGRGVTLLPYGNEYEPGRCNVGSSGVTIERVKNRAECVGGVPGLYDMVGNVNEWVDSCSGEVGADDGCYVRESFYASDGTVTCATVGSRIRSSTHGARGFRCCAP
ncbi:MAG: hypothetical protein BGO98_14490 [Myxococcales bacterium 68-20]|nr:SUMF1/EgtB/PvdO family nonheme iron enzyme [Myxococcales bacterium]OJY19517.1 MAG: hypothetical protein BGO98_14490 [Myxococcales bacterium 68-20]